MPCQPCKKAAQDQPQEDRWRKVYTNDCVCALVYPDYEDREDQYSWNFKTETMEKQVKEWVAGLREGDEVAVYDSMERESLVRILPIERIVREGIAIVNGEDIMLPLVFVKNGFMFDGLGRDVSQHSPEFRIGKRMRIASKENRLRAEHFKLVSFLEGKSWKHTSLEKLREAAALFGDYDPNIQFYHSRR